MLRYEVHYLFSLTAGGSNRIIGGIVWEGVTKMSEADRRDGASGEKLADAAGGEDAGTAGGEELSTTTLV